VDAPLPQPAEHEIRDQLSHCCPLRIGPR
jgi:hypothetical protein